MTLKVYYGGHSITDKGILRLKLKTDFTQQEEMGALYATIVADMYSVSIDGSTYGQYIIDGLRIDSKFDTTLTLKGSYDSEIFGRLYEHLKSTTEDEMCVVVIERVARNGGVC